MDLPVVKLIQSKHYRIIPSVYPTINFFEDLVDSQEMEILWEIESLTNERLRQETGDIFLVPMEDRVSGPGSSVVMAAFTHIGKPSRFSDGTYGIYYASLTQETAIHETVYHRERFFSATKENPCEITMRMYEAKILKPLHDVRVKKYQRYHHPDEYADSQKFGKKLRAIQSWGLIYNSVRDVSGQCIALLRPPATSMPIQKTHLRYVWDGNKIVDVLEAKSVIAY
jgi:hypothetical protein